MIPPDFHGHGPAKIQVTDTEMEKIRGGRNVFYHAQYTRFQWVRVNVVERGGLPALRARAGWIQEL